MVDRAVFQAAAVRLFDTFGDIIEDVTYTKPGAWDIVAETQTPASVETVRIKAAPFKRHEIDGDNVMVGDLNALVIQAEIVATPEIDDTILWDGVTYLVRSVGNVHKVVWRLQLRRV